MLAIIKSAAVLGIDSYVVTVEVDLANGLPTFAVVGLPDTAVKEAKDRVAAAIRNSDFKFPTRKLTVNLAPADVKKEGAAFDLPIAIGIVAAQGYINNEKLDGYCFVGELALDGSLRPVKGILPIALGMRSAGVKTLIVPSANAPEASMAEGLIVYGVKSLTETVNFLNGEVVLQPAVMPDIETTEIPTAYEIDFSEVKGQQFAKRAMEVAAAGGHNLIMVGPPGSGKTMLAKRLVTILPPQTLEEALETTKIHSVAGTIAPGTGLLKTRPFRSPHHTVSNIALVGGGSYPRPGEVSLSHNGVLFLDELPEFHRDVLEVLRQPLEDAMVTVARARAAISFPASFMFVGAMNPCPCGNYGHPEKDCLCTPHQVRRYRSKISQPLLDRIDIHLEVPALKMAELTAINTTAETSSVIRERVLRARNAQKQRFTGQKIHCNAKMGPRHLKAHCRLDPMGEQMLKAAIERLGMSARAYDRVLKVARTIADLEGKPNIESVHIGEAIGYRGLDRA